MTRTRVGTQLELIEELAVAGCRVTQATVSRDLAQMRLQKREDALGRPRYVLPAQRERRADPAEALRRILGEFGRSVTAAQNIVVVQAELGSAPAVARALDRIGHARIVGTLAGDDTCLVIAADAADARSLATELGEALAP